MPIALQLSERRAVVVGEGPKADARAARLRDAGAEVFLVSPAAYAPQVCDGAFVVVANSDDAALNRRAAQDARRAGCLAYAHDDPGVSDFAMPAIAQRGPIKIAISTDATAPALARRLREQIEQLLESSGIAFDALAKAMASRREELPRDQRGPQLSNMARRVHINGHLTIEPEE